MTSNKAMKIFVCSRFPNLVKELRAAIKNVDFYDACTIPLDTPFASAKIPEVHLEKLYNSEIVIADFNLIAPFLNTLTKTAWIQGTWAGIDFLTPYIDPNNPPRFKVTRFSGGIISKQLLDYVLANIINYERNFFHFYMCQRQKRQEFLGFQTILRTIAELTIGVLGVGEIGGEITRAFKGLGATVLSYGRNERNPKEFDEYFTKSGLSQLLEKSDYVINVLPDTPETRGLLAGDVLRSCKGRTVFINIGRGSIIPEVDLVTALKEKWLRGAILDVFQKEPLSLESPLWDMEQVILTPHIAGRPTVKELVALIKENVTLYLEKKPLKFTVDFVRGY